MLQSIPLLGVPIHALTHQEALEAFMGFTDGSVAHFCATPNAEILLQAAEDPEYQSILRRSSLNLPDAVSLQWAGAVQQNHWGGIRSLVELLFLPLRRHFWKNTFPEIIPGSDFYLSICRAAEERNKSIFFLGGQGRVPEANALKIKRQFPDLRVAGFLEGDPSPTKDHEAQKLINEATPDILLVAFGAPTQEKWIARNLPHLGTVKAAIGLGGSFDFVSGHIKRSPKFFRLLGIEWFYRLLRQPTRYNRIWNAVVRFPVKVLTGN